MRKLILGAVLAAMAVPAGAPALAQRSDRHDNYGRDDRGRDDDRHDNGRHNGWNNGRGNVDYSRDAHRYDYNRPDPRYGGYDASRYYRKGNYSERRLGRNDRIYRGSNGQYYCRRNDGTTGLIVGGVLGGLLGNTVANGRSTTLATVLGAGGGALLGRSVDRGNVRCR